jgi:hypothetical protein
MKYGLCVLFFLVLPASATISPVQSAANWSGTSSTECDVSFTTTTAGHLMVVWGEWQTSSANTVAITTTTDTQGVRTLYSAVGPTVQSTGNIAGQILYVKNISGGPDGVNLKFSGTVTASACVIVEYSGADPFYPLDSVSAGYSYATTPGTALDSGAAAPANPNFMVFGAGFVDATGTPSAGSGFTIERQNTTGPFCSFVEDNYTLTTPEVLQHASASCSNSGDWLMQMAVFRTSSWTVTGGWNPARPAQVQFADQFPGADPCAQTKAAIEAPVSNNNSPVVDSRGFVGTAIPCLAAPMSNVDTGEWLPSSGAWQFNKPLILGGTVDVWGTSIGYDAAHGTGFLALNSVWAGGFGGVAPTDTTHCSNNYLSTCTYWRGTTAVNTSITYYALQNNFTGVAPPSTGDHWTLAANFPSPVAEVNMTTTGHDVESNSLHNLSLTCQYFSGSNQMTDGCVGYLNTDGQENVILDRAKIRNPTVAGIWMDSPLAVNSGPFGPGIVSYDGTSSTNHAACKTAGSDTSSQQGAISEVQGSNVSGPDGTNTILTVTLSPAPGFTIWVGELVDIVSTNPTLSNIPGLYTDETTKAHGYWMVWSVLSNDNSTFVVQAPSADSGFSCTGLACGSALANFYPVGINASYHSLLLAAPNRGFFGWTVNGTSCTCNGSMCGSNLNSEFPPLAIQSSMGDMPFSNYHTEGFRVGHCVGCFAPSQGQHISNAVLTTNTYTGVLIDNKFSVTGVDVRDLNCNTSGPLPDKYCLIDLGNGNLLTRANNPYVHHYWTDANGVAYLEGGNCSELSKGFCVNNGVAAPVKLPIATLTANAPCNAGSEGAHAVATDCTTINCTAGNACVGGGGTHCEVYCNATPAWVETGR